MMASLDAGRERSGATPGAYDGGRYATVDEVGGAICFLLGPDAGRDRHDADRRRRPSAVRRPTESDESPGPRRAETRSASWVACVRRGSGSRRRRDLLIGPPAHLDRQVCLTD